MKLLAFGIRVLYRLFSLFPRQDKVVFMSRQSARPFDYQLLEPALRARLGGMRIVWACGRETQGGPRVGLTFRQVWHAATARLVVVDGYMPAIAIPSRPHRAPCVLLWHALGAIKKFGWAAVGTADGRTLEQAQAGCMHRGYDVVVAGLPDAVEALAAGLDVAPDAVHPLGLPRIDYLCDDEFSEQREADAASLSPEGARSVLYAPTLRRGQEATGSSSNVLAQALADLDAALPPDYTLLVASHPLVSAGSFALESGRVHVLPEGFSAIQAFGIVDCVITDYSAVAYEAAVAGRQLLFFVPDIDEYRTSPGVNIDPVASFPDAAFADAHSVARAVQEGTDAGPALVAGGVPKSCRAAIAEACAACLGLPKAAE